MGLPSGFAQPLNESVLLMSQELPSNSWSLDSQSTKLHVHTEQPTGNMKFHLWRASYFIFSILSFSYTLWIIVPHGTYGNGDIEKTVSTQEIIYIDFILFWIHKPKWFLVGYKERDEMYPYTSGLNDNKKLHPRAFAIGLKWSSPCNVAVS